MSCGSSAIHALPDAAGLPLVAAVSTVNTYDVRLSKPSIEAVSVGLLPAKAAPPPSGHGPRRQEA